MIGTLTTSAGGISERLPPLNYTGISGRLHLFNSFRFTYKPISTKSAFHAVLDANPVERTAGSRRPESLYEVLRVDRNATPSEIKTAYRSLAKIYHPDAKLHGDRDFIEIHNAYATLSDPASRASYDLKSRLYTVVGRRQGFYTCQRWETDQCW
ncbi:hypothetical protein R6Q59_018674 [Mikania micrantha]|uniref:J domain-containing protein n=1 Tax=Mikania micrantha TaxID=192012 RepID=A0A5N6M2W3_9ASTR|nr:hypothetical protein E3N88_35133 [Mikania micrantha]